MITPLLDDVAEGTTSPKLTATPLPSALRHTDPTHQVDGSSSPTKTVSFVDAQSERTGTDARGRCPTGADASPVATVSVLSASTDYGWEDDASSSGYAGGGTEEETLVEGKPNSYLPRLIRFYEMYNKEKLSRAEQFLTAYRGDEEQLFRILVQKYGPEPPAPPEPAPRSTHPSNKSETRSDAGNGSVMHFSGTLRTLPKVVSAIQGGTTMDTPYWPGNTRISDQDLLFLLRMLRTDNEELSKWYVGVLAQHPASCNNGMTYISRTPMPSSSTTEGDATFLGHVWTGRLANNKAVVHDGASFSRTILQCTEACQANGQHDRWRLTVYRSDNSPLALYRTLWDPVIDDVPHGAASRERTVPSRGRRLESQPLQPISSSTHHHTAGASGGVDHTIAPALASVESQMTKLISIVVSFEQRVTKRLESIENRLITLERRK